MNGLRAVVAGTLGLLGAALFVATVALRLAGGEDDPAAYVWTLALLGFVLVGALIAWKRPENRFGWVTLGVGLAALLQSAAYGWTALAAASPSSLLGAGLAAWATSWASAPLAIGLLVFIPLLFPDGRPPARRWRVLLWLSAIWLAGSVVLLALKPGPVEDLPVENPWGVEAFGFARTFYDVGFPFVGLLGLAAFSSLALRYQRSGAEQRQQIKWVVWSFGVMFVGVAVTSVLDVLSVTPGPLADLATVSTVLTLPVAMAVGVLRYRLYAIDRLISRTVAWAALTLLLLLMYLVMVVLLQRLLAPLTGESDLAVAGATLAVAALFTPLRRRVQQTVDHRFDRAHYDAERTVAAFRDRLRDEVDLAELQADLTATVGATVQPAGASLWLRSPESTQ